MSKLDAHGLGVDAPPGWEARIFRRPEAGELHAAEVPGAAAPMGERVYPIVHAATVPLPMDMADYGSDVVEALGPADALIVVKEFDPADAGQALFARDGMPRALAPTDFDPATLQRRIDGQAGCQVFFHERGRAFCVYVVLGSYDARLSVVPNVNRVLGTIRIESSSTAVMP